MTKYENQTIENKTLVIEECLFVTCVLKNCDLFYSGGDSEWANLRFENCRWHFRAGALKTVQLLQTLGLLKPFDQAQQVPPTPVGPIH
jgi:hypothetical protein